MRQSAVIISLISLMTLMGACGQSNEMDVNKVEEVSYSNPISLEDEWEDYGLGDPYILKYNGMYYLYPSTRDTDTGIKVWQSANLVDWDYQGIVAEIPETQAAYAPEVIYWNGLFYMYTSPAGNGHYVLQSESPTGPFELATDNFGKSIDGNVFVDDDGSMYFSHAGVSGIEVSKMLSPLALQKSEVTNAFMDGWTEGSTIFKRHGKYYMTYTGNHVFSNGYRVDYAVSDDPVKDYVASSKNPILLSTEGPTVGLGHNSLVRGPDLDTDYIVYHNLEGEGVVGPLRHMNIDRIAWNGLELDVLGPTTTEQDGPIRPTFEDYFNRKKLGGNWEKIKGKWVIENQEFLRQSSTNADNMQTILTKEPSEQLYTAEFHLKKVEEDTDESAELYGAVFSYQDEENFGLALLNATDNTFQTKFTIAGVESEWQISPLPAEFDHTKLHQIRVEKAIGGFRFYVDGMQKQTKESLLSGGKIGYTTQNTQAEFGYTAFSNLVDGSGVFDAYKPVPGTIQSVHYQSESTNTEEPHVYRLDEKVAIHQEDEQYYVRLKEADQLSYKVNIAEVANYQIDFRYLADVDSELIVKLDGQSVSESISLSQTNEWRTVTVKNLALETGKHELSIELVQGDASFEEMTFYEAGEREGLTDSFEEVSALDWLMYESYWAVDEDHFMAGDREYSKVMIGQDNWLDYSVEATIELTEKEGEAGILLRATNPANGRELGQNNEDFIQGYYVRLTTEGVSLRKQNYGHEELVTKEMQVDVNKPHSIKVEAIGTTVKIYVDNLENPIITFDDGENYPYTHGKVGLASANNQAKFYDFSLEHQ